MNVHGHTHRASGQGWLGKLRVINPGSVRYGGNFASLTIRRRAVGDPWAVESVELRTL